MSLPAGAQSLVAFYQIGGDPDSRVKWDTYVIDSSSIVRKDGYLHYRSFRITSHGSDPADEIKADCLTHRRGLSSDRDMYATYPGTLSGEEVSAACSIAEQPGLFQR